ncbi:hypothetical protein D3C81_2227400 [compost metagenome]
MSTGPHSMSSGPRCSVVGIGTPNSPNASERYTPQNLAMTAAASSISRMRSQPMIQAASSPIVAYENVYADPATGSVEANSA